MKHKRVYDLVVWDWNGTLLDDTATCYEIANDMRLERGMERIGHLDDYRAIFGFPVMDYYRRMGYTFETEPYESISEEFIRLYAERVSGCPLQPYAEETLRSIAAKGAMQVLLSATGQAKLEEQAALFGLTDYFTRIIGNRNDLAHGKADYARAFLRESGVLPERTLLVGDTDHDFEIARSLGCGCALLVPGHQSRERLATLGAVLIDSLDEVPPLL